MKNHPKFRTNVVAYYGCCFVLLTTISFQPCCLVRSFHLQSLVREAPTSIRFAKSLHHYYTHHHHHVIRQNDKQLVRNQKQPTGTKLFETGVSNVLLYEKFDDNDDDDETKKQSTCADSNDNNTSNTIVLLSLKWAGTSGTTTTTPTPTTTTAANSGQLAFSKAVTDVWRWKDKVLGDGRDFFVPKPKTVSALQRYLLESSSKDNNFSITECVVLSNCARFEIILVVDGADKSGKQERQQQKSNQNEDVCEIVNQVIESISRAIVIQECRFQKSYFNVIQLPFDIPECIIDPPANDRMIGSEMVDSNNLRNRISEVSKHWQVVSGIRNVTEHLCLVAAGMAQRPRRPDRVTVFRPFSSRDSHILLQLKRTLEIASPSSSIQPRSRDNVNGYNTISSTLLRYALQAGKAVRDPTIVPLLLELRKYGTGDSKFDSAPPSDLIRSVTLAAKQQAIDPIVIKCTNALYARTNKDKISIFRQKAIDLAENYNDSTDRKRNMIRFVKKLLHEPTIRLRNGEVIDEILFMTNLSRDLQKMEATAMPSYSNTTTNYEKMYRLVDSDYSKS